MPLTYFLAVHIMEDVHLYSCPMYVASPHHVSTIRTSPETHREHHSNNVPRVLKGALNYSPITPRGISLSDG